MSSAALQERFTSRRVSYLSASLESRLDCKSSVSSFSPRKAVFSGVRSSWEMYRTYDFFESIRAYYI